MAATGANGECSNHSGINFSLRTTQIDHGDFPAEILARAQTGRFILQDLRPLADSIEWELGQRYLQESGNKAFIRDAEPVPFAVNNDGELSAPAAEVFFARPSSATSSYGRS